MRPGPVLMLLAGALATSGCATVKPDEAASAANAALERASKAAPMKPWERDLLAAVYGPGLDLDRLRLRYAGEHRLLDGAARTLQDAIYFDRTHNLLDPEFRASGRFVRVLVHEAAHVWQYQNVGLGYIPDSLYNQGIGTVLHKDRNAAYTYTLDAARAFGSYDSEQQAQIVEEYVSVLLLGTNAPRCTNYEALGRAAFLDAAEAVIRRGLHPQLVRPPADSVPSGRGR